MSAPVEQRVAVPVDDPNADTEWYSPDSNSFYNLRLVPNNYIGMKYSASIKSSLKSLHHLHL